jgi:spore coat polysaccharide biosynthesis protein SpsF
MDKKMKENVVVFVVARLSSSRLPKKHLRKIGNKRLIDWTIENTKKSKLVDKIVIATTDEEENSPLMDVAKEHNIDTFLYNGDINDVVGRLAHAAVEFSADIPILISGDCPLIWAESLDKMIEKILQDRELDHVYFCQRSEKPTIHEGMGVYRKKCWMLADKLSDKPNLREHQFPIIGIKSDMFKTCCITDDELFYKIKHRISVDTPADLEFMNVVYNELKKEKKEFNMPNVVELLLEKPDIVKINKDVHQIKVDEKTKKALFIIKNEDNLDLFLNMAYDLTKRGVGIRFLAHNKAVCDKIEHAGYGIAIEPNRDKFDFVIEG